MDFNCGQVLLGCAVRSTEPFDIVLEKK
jgi:hypothetical protein